MRQSHYVCEDIEFASRELFPALVDFFVKNKFRANAEHITHEDTTFYDSYSLRLLTRGGHCKVVSAIDKTSNEQNIVIELRHGKQNRTKRFSADSLNFTTEELSKIFGFNKELIPIINTQSDVSHIFMEYTTPDAWFGDLKPHFDFVSSEITANNCKYGSTGKAFIFSLIDRTELLYNKHIASTFSADVDYCFDVFDSFMKSRKIKKISSHAYQELLKLSEQNKNSTFEEQSE